MMTIKEVDKLLQVPKKVVEGVDLVDFTAWSLSIDGAHRVRYELREAQGSDTSFLLDINRSRKNSLKLSLYCLERDMKIGLLRVDYNGTHKNPEEITSDLPSKFKRHAGKWFDFSDHHIHYYVEGYPPLVWAIPLADDEFPLKELQNVNDALFATEHFAHRINLQTKFTRAQHELA